MSGRNRGNRAHEAVLRGIHGIRRHMAAWSIADKVILCLSAAALVVAIAEWIMNPPHTVVGVVGAMLLCGNHNYKKTTFDLMIGKITLEDGSWVGAQAVVCPGVTLRTHAVLGVGAVANHDLEAYTIYQGIPAVKVRERVMD